MSSYRNFWWVEVYVINSSAGKVCPARGQPLFYGLERYIKVDDCVHAVSFIQTICL